MGEFRKRVERGELVLGYAVNSDGGGAIWPGGLIEQIGPISAAMPDLSRLAEGSYSGE